MRFLDRRDAGRSLARLLSAYAGRPDVVVLALPRGGLPVADEVSRALDAPLDVFLVRKLGVPGYEELAFGAVAEGGVEVVNRLVVTDLRISPEAVARVAARERAELEQRAARYRDRTPPLVIAGRTVTVIDDGLATGATMEAAIRALRARAPARLVAAAPVGARETCDRLAQLADEVVCAIVPESFQAVGLWYADFSQLTDGDVRAVLAESRRRMNADG
jgi:predicted phosphoribosyltransferase